MLICRLPARLHHINGRLPIARHHSKLLVFHPYCSGYEIVESWWQEGAKSAFNHQFERFLSLLFTKGSISAVVNPYSIECIVIFI